MNSNVNMKYTLLFIATGIYCVSKNIYFCISRYFPFHPLPLALRTLSFHAFSLLLARLASNSFRVLARIIRHREFRYRSRRSNRQIAGGGNNPLSTLYPLITEPEGVTHWSNSIVLSFSRTWTRVHTPIRIFWLCECLCACVLVWSWNYRNFVVLSRFTTVYFTCSATPFDLRYRRDLSSYRNPRQPPLRALALSSIAQFIFLPFSFSLSLPLSFSFDLSAGHITRQWVYNTTAIGDDIGGGCSRASVLHDLYITLLSLKCMDSYSVFRRVTNFSILRIILSLYTHPYLLHFRPSLPLSFAKIVRCFLTLFFHLVPHPCFLAGRNRKWSNYQFCPIATYFLPPYKWTTLDAINYFNVIHEILISSVQSEWIAAGKAFRVKAYIPLLLLCMRMCCYAWQANQTNCRLPLRLSVRSYQPLDNLARNCSQLSPFAFHSSLFHYSLPTPSKSNTGSQGQDYF